MMLFLSHAGPDKPLVRRLGTHLQVSGAEVFFDEWNIGAGESISGAIEDAIDAYETFVLVWSKHADASTWARREYRAAVKAFVEEPTRRLIPVLLDDTAVPRLVADLRYVDLRDEGRLGDAVDLIMGFTGAAERTKATQAFLEEGAIEVHYFHGYGPAVGCPACGTGLTNLEQWSQMDYERDDTYAGARCIKCGWEDGGEV